MGGFKKIPSEGGSGGKRGHSAVKAECSMAEVKDAARVRRRLGDREAVREGLVEVSRRRSPRKRRRYVSDAPNGGPNGIRALVGLDLTFSVRGVAIRH